MGTVSCFRVFVKMFTEVTEPITELLRNNVTFLGKDRQNQTYEKLKNETVSAKTLAFPNFMKKFAKFHYTLYYYIMYCIITLQGYKRYHKYIFSICYTFICIHNLLPSNILPTRTKVRGEPHMYIYVYI